MADGDVVLDPGHEALRARVQHGELSDRDRAALTRLVDAVHQAVAVCDAGEHRDSGIDGLWAHTAREYRGAISPELER